MIWIAMALMFWAGMGFGCWWSWHNHGWSKALKELDLEIAEDKLAEAKEYRRAEALQVMQMNEQQAERRKYE